MMLTNTSTHLCATYLTKYIYCSQRIVYKTQLIILIITLISTAALIALQLNPMIGSGELDNYTIIQLNEYNINNLPNGKFVLGLLLIIVVLSLAYIPFCFF